MKRCELIRNIASVAALGGFGFSIFAGALKMLTTAELVTALTVSVIVGVISFIMDKIANEKDC